jgi:CheY-like chemotaxis protein
VLVVDDQADHPRVHVRPAGWLGTGSGTLAGSAARDAIPSDPQHFDLVITDQTMPQLTGLALAEADFAAAPGAAGDPHTGYAKTCRRSVHQGWRGELVRKPIEPAQFSAARRSPETIGNKTAGRKSRGNRPRLAPPPVVPLESRHGQIS